tara:strand:+ start:3166 stop:4962 length:1797 start_codon:yes stop_codon:yes gene_type:complete
MDPILSRKLFRQKALQTHKPLGFRTGAILDFKEIARQRSPGGITQLAGGPNPNNLKSEADYREQVERKDVDPISKVPGYVNIMQNAIDKEIFSEENVKKEVIRGYDESKAKQKDKEVIQNLNAGISNIKNEQIKPPVNQNFIDQRIQKLKTEDKIDRIKVLENKKKEAEQTGLFSQSEKFGIFAGMLAKSLGTPGATLTSGFTEGVGNFATLYGKTKEVEAELEAAKAKDNRGKKLWVFDSKAEDGKGKNVRIYEDQYDPTTMTKPKTEEKGTMDIVLRKDGKIVVDTIRKEDFDPIRHENFLGTVNVLNKKTNQRDQITKNEFFLDQDLAAEDTQYVRKYELAPNASEDNIVLRNKLAMELKETEAQRKLLTQETAKLEKVARLDQLGLKALGYIKEGARGGAAGVVTQTIEDTFKFVANSLGDRSRRMYNNRYAYEMNAMKEQLKNMEKNPQGSFVSENGDRITIAAFNEEFSNKDAGLQSLIIELAYAKAKAREEGGRFSVSDIQAAMQSIGNVSSDSNLRQKLAESIMNDIQFGVDSFKRTMNTDTLPEQYQFFNESLELYKQAQPFYIKKYEGETFENQGNPKPPSPEPPSPE